MSGEVIQWPAQNPTPSDDTRRRIESILAVFRAIDAGELLAALPECEIARSQHIAALRLLSLAERELLAIYETL